MPTLLQINVTANWGSTGKIAEQIGLVAQQHGWESYIAYGRDMNPSKNKLIKIGSKLDVYEHYLENRFFDNEGRASRRATKRFLKEVDQIKPDVVHLHNIHDHYLNYELLFCYLAKKKIPVIWTQHDCWAFTGGCAHYSLINCYQWKDECKKCPVPRGKLMYRTNCQFNLRKEVILPLKKITLVPVSEWLENEIRKSFLGSVEICTILNGVDVNVFTPSPSFSIRNKYQIGDKRFLIAVANVWTQSKGLSDYIKLADLLDRDMKLVLVGLSDKQSQNLPQNIIPIPRTQNVNELAQLYTEASIVLNLSYQETFGLTTVEGFACGTPGIVYNCTASPELITKDVGIVVDAGDIEGVKVAIHTILRKDKNLYTENCRKLAMTKYDKNRNFDNYIKLYNQTRWRN